MNSVNCKVTVRSAVKSSPPLMRRQTVGDTDPRSIRDQSQKRTASVYKGYADTLYNGFDESEEDDTAEIAVLCEEAPTWSTRRRAYTTSSMSTSTRVSNILNPLCRLTMRWTESLNDTRSSKATDSCTSSTPSQMDTHHPVLTVINLASSFLDVDTDGNDDTTRPTIENVARLMTGTHSIPSSLTVDMLSTEYEASPTPPHVLLTNTEFPKNILPIVIGHLVETDDGDTADAVTNEYSEESSNYLVDNSRVSHDPDQTVCKADSLQRIIDSQNSKFYKRHPHERADGIAHNIRLLSRLLSHIIRPCIDTAQGIVQAPDMSATMTAHLRDSETPSLPMYHGLELHLSFTRVTGQIIQVQGYPKRRGKHKNPFSRRIRCHAIYHHSHFEDGDTLRIIGHNTDGLLYGGDCISFARTDGTVLRMQKISKKLTFSNKVDDRAKFIITGVPDRTPVTSASKFQLQSSYDRKKFMGFLPSRHSNKPGCLSMYDHGNAESKVEPILFSKRHPERDPVFWYDPRS
ncbi:uncharacterized protein PHALS_11836 [Plasmopara halstedii]|uniref:Uncharacterized protein n=1 Tax=Plasmopara halstedii TaxID=4781 RepID=A0A0P1AK85_PLAHL|nr:uncharacterized protein PHALS_11836 [Plasmopara halstedii]CEG41495.1 hypothetical protein PHALS_11836 [Plasmopara halstedii]|eukprot:XP_024577864.1 hypothetical protein PHALS_11836 [Plasmopara halstedii]